MDEVFNKMDDIISKEQLSDFYYEMFIIDAFIGNTDRHNGNWALLQSSDGIQFLLYMIVGHRLPLLLMKALSLRMLGWIVQ